MSSDSAMARWSVVVIVALAFTAGWPGSEGETPAEAAAPKVTVCHKPDTPAERTIQIASSALQSHLAHGDLEGDCDGWVCPFEAEFLLPEQINVPFRVTSSTQDVSVLGIGPDGGEGNFYWSFERAGVLVASDGPDDFIQLSWYTAVEPGSYSATIRPSDGGVPVAESVLVTCAG